MISNLLIDYEKDDDINLSKLRKFVSVATFSALVLLIGYSLYTKHI